MRRLTNEEAQPIYESTVKLLKRGIPGFEVRFKDEHFLQKLIAVLVYPFNRKYMEDFTSTMYPYVYFPSRDWLKKVGYMTAFRVLSHEYVHLWDEQKEGHLRFKFRYLFPQVLGLLAVLAFFAFLWKPALWALVALAFFAPWPSPGRRDIERRGYLMNLAISHWRHGDVRDDQIRSVVSRFMRWGYYKMWPFKSMAGIVRGDLAILRTGATFTTHPGRPYAEVNALLVEHKVLAT